MSCISALALTPFFPTLNEETLPAGIVDRVDHAGPRLGGGIPGVYGWGPRYGTPEPPRKRSSGETREMKN